jgi:hypothetical protein
MSAMCVSSIQTHASLHGLHVPAESEDGYHHHDTFQG